MKLRSVVGTAFAVTSLAGCAGGAGSVAPIAISSAEYANLNCQEVRAQLQNARTREGVLSERQNHAQMMDTAGMFITLLPVASILGENVAGELAQAKGERIALERAEPEHCADPTATPATAPVAPTATPAIAPAQTAAPNQ